jgi:heat shock protein HslJ
MKNLRFLSLAIILASSVAACSTTPSTQTSPSAAGGSSTALSTADLAGTWSLVQVERAGMPTQSTPTGASYSINFSDGRVSTRADCNMCGGSIAVSGQTVTIGPALACTRAACPTMEFESVYESVLSGDHSVSIQGGTLVLSSKRGTLRFSR